MSLLYQHQESIMANTLGMHIYSILIQHYMHLKMDKDEILFFTVLVLSETNHHKMSVANQV